MKWFRSNIRHGSRLALVALAIQFALSFGHFHGMAAQAAPAIQSSDADLVAASDTAASQSTQPQPSPDREPGQQPADNCAICAVIALANNVLFATPPLLQLPQAIEFLYQTTDAGFVRSNSVRVAFQPRAPPAS